MASDLVPLQYIVFGSPDNPRSGVWINVAEVLLLIEMRAIGASDGAQAALINLKDELAELLDVTDENH